MALGLDMSALEPCPFCGGQIVKLCKTGEGDRFYFECDACYATGESCLTIDDAAQAWNTRCLTPDLIDLIRSARELAKYRKRTGALNFQLEKADDWLRRIEIALDNLNQINLKEE